MRRRTAIPLLLIPLLGSLTACSPPREPIVALGVRDGRPVGVLVTCGGGFSQLEVYENDDTAAASRADVLVEWGVHGSPTSEVVEVVLFGPPPVGWQVEDDDGEVPGWEPETTIRLEQLTELRPGVRYSISGESGNVRGLPTDFTVSDLGRVGRGTVLAAVDHDTTRLMSRKSFLSRARAACD